MDFFATSLDFRCGAARGGVLCSTPYLKAMPITTMNTVVTTIDSRTRITGHKLPQMVWPVRGRRGGGS
jgi:hypothetical protein